MEKSHSTIHLHMRMRRTWRVVLVGTFLLTPLALYADNVNVDVEECSNISDVCNDQSDCCPNKDLICGPGNVCCKDIGIKCTDSDECCFGNCNSTFLGEARCAHCKSVGEPCQFPQECCYSFGLICYDKKCCKKPDQDCNKNADCCFQGQQGSNVCINGKCNLPTPPPVDTACRIVGKDCSEHPEERCCQQPLRLRCSPQTSKCCIMDNQRCYLKEDCCSGNCGPDRVCGSNVVPTWSLLPFPDNSSLTFLQPFSSQQTLGAMSYVSAVWKWLIGIGVGLALLRIVIGGIEIMNSGGNPGLRTTAKDHILWAIVGLLMLIFAGTILSTIDPSAFGVV